MTKEQFNKKFEDLLSDSFVEKYVKEKKDFLLSSGGVDLESMPNDYSFPKEVLCVCLERLMRQLSPIGCEERVARESKKRIKNIKCFI